MDIVRVVPMFMDAFERKGLHLSRRGCFSSKTPNSTVLEYECCARWGTCTRKKRTHASNHSVPALWLYPDWCGELSESRILGPPDHLQADPPKYLEYPRSCTLFPPTMRTSFYPLTNPESADRP